jgi:SAM-dependent methyltransferase
MPTSQFRQLNEIVEAIVFSRPRSVLDIGVGYAKYGVLTREYLDHGWCRPEGTNRTCRVDGIEGFPAYVSPLHSLVYDHLYVGDAREILPRLQVHYDLALLIDVIEHFEMEDGVRLLNELSRHASNILISTPRRFSAQEAVYGNQLEIHRSHWRPEHFEPFTPRCFIPNEESIICMIGPVAERIDARMNSWRQVVKRQAPWLVKLYRKGRNLLDAPKQRPAADRGFR